MSLKKLPDDELWNNKQKQCRHPEHEPPSMRVYEPGTYEYTCPHCGKKTVFTVPGIYL